MLSGADLSIEAVTRLGEMPYVPRGAAHRPVNTSENESLRLIFDRNAPVEFAAEVELASRIDC